MVGRSLVAGAALMGGFVWLVRWLTGNTADPDLLRWIGLALVLVAALGVGASLVKASNTALRSVVAVCFAALVWALVELLAGAGGTLALGLCGAVLTLAGLLGMLNARQRDRAALGGTRHGSRARRGEQSERRGGRRAR